MTVPLDRLYHYISDIAKEQYCDDILIYRFWPHGSKNLNDLNPLNLTDWSTYYTVPGIYCNDQEPLDFDFFKDQASKLFDNISENNTWLCLLRSINQLKHPQNLNIHGSLFEKSLLVHSEQRSTQLTKYRTQTKLIPVYYWSHALIACDWFRYAKYEIFRKTSKNTFLIYNRAWSGTREYRLKFTELLIELNLHNHCQTSFNSTDPGSGVHYSDHKFKNSTWQPTRSLEHFFPANNISSHASADFDSNDYNSTDIEIVLETLFDDDRLHLTEKSLRPMACGQPFILAGTHGSLEYLRSYGFKTFDNIWDESYDQITNSEKRLIAILDVMKSITSWDPCTKTRKLAQAQEIADYNRCWFFSQEFSKLIVNELKTNFKSAFDELKQCNHCVDWIDNWSNLLSHEQVVNFIESNKNPRYPTIEQFNVVQRTVDEAMQIVNNP